MQIPWPEAYKTFISWFNPANLDFVQVWNPPMPGEHTRTLMSMQITGVDCATKVDYYDKLVILCVVPVLICIGLVVFYLIPGAWRGLH